MLSKIYNVTLKVRADGGLFREIEYEVEAPTRSQAFKKARRRAIESGYADVRKVREDYAALICNPRKGAGK
ncbi:hypothetical protein [Listeria ilorinensis]|uniref:hypothetical protein n=1 Tax=Listeria ilorinensis TaxID=2867439 RepID=UPI001EF3E278|nr:hypothetical protein [Listeria ilorinensis]